MDVHSDEHSKPNVLSDTRSPKNLHRQVENAAVAGCQEDMIKSKQMEQHNRKLTDAAPVMSNKDSYPSFIWCIAKTGANVYALQTALNWTCSKRGGNINCSPILAGGVCYLPNNIQTHSSWAFNAYFYNNPREYDSCDFNGTAILAYTDLSMPIFLFYLLSHYFFMCISLWLMTQKLFLSLQDEILSLALDQLWVENRHGCKTLHHLLRMQTFPE